MSRKTTGVEAVLFDFGGTLFDYNCLRPTMHDALIQLCDRAQVEASETSRTVAYVAALRKSFSRHVGTDFYLMRDIFREAAVDTLEWLTALDDLTKAAADPLSGLDDSPQLIVQRARCPGLRPVPRCQRGRVPTPFGCHRDIARPALSRPPCRHSYQHGRRPARSSARDRRAPNRTRPHALQRGGGVLQARLSHLFRGRPPSGIDARRHHVRRRQHLPRHRRRQARRAPTRAHVTPARRARVRDQAPVPSLQTIPDLVDQVGG